MLEFTKDFKKPASKNNVNLPNFFEEFLIIGVKKEGLFNLIHKKTKIKFLFLKFIILNKLYFF